MIVNVDIELLFFSLFFFFPLVLLYSVNLMLLFDDSRDKTTHVFDSSPSCAESSYSVSALDST